MESPILTIVTPTFNRLDTISRCIESALAFCLVADIYDHSEMIIVDDKSVDQTIDFIETRYSDFIQSGWIKLIKRERNLGFLAARNLGVQNAKGEWILFLDSDDALIPESAHKVLSYLKNNDQAFIYFRSIDGDTNNLVGPKTDTHLISYFDYINDGTVAESLPVIKRDLVSRYPYDEDMRASAGLAYARMIKECQNILWTDCIARVFFQSGSDRLTFKRLARAKYFLRGYIRFLKEHFASLRFKKKINLIIKICVYGFIVLLQKLKIIKV